MAVVKYPTESTYHNSFSSDWKKNFKTPRNLALELRKKFPLWKELQKALNQKVLKVVPGCNGLNNQVLVWGLLHTYLDCLAKITPEEIVSAAKNGSIKELVERAHEAIKLKAFIENREIIYFPEMISKREEALRQAVESWD